MRPDNEQGEYYLTDVIGILSRAGARVEAVMVADPIEAQGVNDRRQLAAVAAIQRRRILDALMEAGVTIVDPASTYIEETVTIGPDTVVDPQNVIEGTRRIGSECVIGAGSHVSGSQIAERVVLKPYSSSRVRRRGRARRSGPSATCGPAAHVGAAAQIGNFVELKKTRMGRRTKAHHLAYLGDATVGERRQHRRGHHHVQLQRRREAPTTIETGPSSAPTRAWWRRSPSGPGPTWAPAR